MLTRWTRFIGAAVVSCTLSGLLVAGDDEIRKSFWDGIKAYDSGDDAGAKTAFDAGLAQNPSPDLAAALRDEVGEKRLSDMWAKGGDVRDVAMRILKASRGVYAKVAHDPAEIDAVVSKLDAPGFDDWWVATNKLMAIGQWSTPSLVSVLGNEANDNWRSKAIVTLTKMGDQAVMPLAAAMASKNELVRKNAAMTLGDIGDSRALPFLRRAIEDPSESCEVKSSAAEAFAKIVGKKNPNDSPCAAALFVELAERFYHADPSAMAGTYPDPLVFSWDGAADKLVATQVPESALGDCQAIQAGHAALAIDSCAAKAYPVLVSAYYKLAVDYAQALDVATKNLAAGQGTQAEVDALKASAAEAEKGKLFGPMSGRRGLYAALSKVLAEKNDAAVASIMADLSPYVNLTDVPKAPGGAEPPKAPDAGGAEPPKAQNGPANPGVPLLQALIDEDKRVRYPAAIAIAEGSPKGDFVGSAQVARVLADAVGERGIWQVIVADPSPEVRNSMTAILKRLNCNVTTLESPMEAMKRAKGFPGADLIVLGSKSISHIVFGVPKFSEPGTNYTESVYDSLKQDLRTKDTPIWLLADDADPEKAAFADKVQAVLSRTPDEPGVKAALVAVFGTDQMKKSAKARAEEVAQKAAETLASLDPRMTSIPVGVAVPALCEALVGRQDAVRIPAATALGRIGNPMGIAPLVQAYGDKGASKEFRIAAATAAARIFQASGEAPSSEVYLALKRAVMTEPDVDIACAAAAALGWSDLSAEQRRDLFEARRLVK